MYFRLGAFFLASPSIQFPSAVIAALPFSKASPGQPAPTSADFLAYPLMNRSLQALSAAVPSGLLIVILVKPSSVTEPPAAYNQASQRATSVFSTKPATSLVVIALASAANSSQVVGGVLMPAAVIMSVLT